MIWDTESQPKSTQSNLKKEKKNLDQSLKKK